MPRIAYTLTQCTRRGNQPPHGLLLSELPGPAPSRGVGGPGQVPATWHRFAQHSGLQPRPDSLALRPRGPRRLWERASRAPHTATRPQGVQGAPEAAVSGASSCPDTPSGPRGRVEKPKPCVKRVVTCQEGLHAGPPPRAAASPSRQVPAGRPQTEHLSDPGGASGPGPVRVTHWRSREARERSPRPTHTHVLGRSPGAARRRGEGEFVQRKRRPGCEADSESRGKF